MAFVTPRGEPGEGGSAQPVRLAVGKSTTGRVLKCGREAALQSVGTSVSGLRICQHGGDLLLVNLAVAEGVRVGEGQPGSEATSWSQPSSRPTHRCCSCLHRKHSQVGTRSLLEGKEKGDGGGGLSSPGPLRQPTASQLPISSSLRHGTQKNWREEPEKSFCSFDSPSKIK